MRHGGGCRFLRSPVLGALVLAAAVAGGCNGDDGDTIVGPQGPAGTSGTGYNMPSTQLQEYENLPGVVLTVTGVAGGSGPGGNLMPGNTPRVTFTLTTTSGTALDLTAMDSAAAWFSGPTFNYQKVLPPWTAGSSYSDVRTASVKNADGSWTYTFPAAIPTTYPAPRNDSANWSDGELTGTGLLDGTYTVCMRIYRYYYIGEAGTSVRDVGNAAVDLLLGVSPGTLAPRAVTQKQNCNNCHGTLQFHGGTYRDTRLCVTCHTAGSEDDYTGSNETIEFKVMIHRIHDGSHLPSVNGVTVDSSGLAQYGTGISFMLGSSTSPHTFDKVAFPVMPSAYVSYLYDTAGTTYQGAAGNGPMPRDTGYSSLSATAKLAEDRVRTGVVACAKCHGDPDGTGLLSAPAQGNNYLIPSRNACGSCHDDVKWSQTTAYARNSQTMGQQLANANCTNAGCHTSSGTALSVQDAHTHPYSNATLNTGVNVAITAAGGGTGTGGNHQAGDPISATFSVRNNASTDLALNSLTRFQMMVVGPTSNTQLILPNVNALDTAFRKGSPFTGSGTITTPAVAAGATAQTIGVEFTSSTAFDVVGSVSSPLTGQSIGLSSGSTAAVTYNGVSFTMTQGATVFAADDRWYFEAVPVATSYTMNVPLDITYERVGTATGLAQGMTVANAPLYWGRQTVYEVTGVAAGTTLTSAAPALGRYATADNAALVTAAIIVGDKVVLDSGTLTEEYLTIGRIQTTDDVTGADLGTLDRVWFTKALRYAHGSGTALQEPTLSTRREGATYAVTNPGTGTITLVASAFTSGNPVVVTYRTDGRFGWYRAPGDTRQAIFSDPAADSDDVGPVAGDWKGLPLLDGTYTVAIWANRDFTVAPAGAVTTTESWNNWTSNNTTYRMIAPATGAQKQFLFGAATTLVSRTIISSAANCDACHNEVMAHGYGRSGLDRCLLCHSIPGTEDGPKYSFNSWYTPPTQGVSMDFRVLLHKVHAGEDLVNPSTFTPIGVFLAVPYILDIEDHVFPMWPDGTKNCTKCHGATSTAWKAPATRVHPNATGQPTQAWRVACTSCHDASYVQAHADLMTSASGVESCPTCHGSGRDQDVAIKHKVR